MKRSIIYISILIVFTLTYGCTQKTQDIPQEETEAMDEGLPDSPEKAVTASGDTATAEHANAEEQRNSDLDARAIEFGTRADN